MRLSLNANVTVRKVSIGDDLGHPVCSAYDSGITTEINTEIMTLFCDSRCYSRDGKIRFTAVDFGDTVSFQNLRKRNAAMQRAVLTPFVGEDRTKSTDIKFSFAYGVTGR